MSTFTRDEAAALANDLGVLAEPHRLLVLGELRGGPRSAGSLARATEMAPSLASHHLAVLLKAGLVTRWREGSFVFYALNRDRMAVVQQALGRLAKPATSPRTNRARPVAAGADVG